MTEKTSKTAHELLQNAFARIKTNNPSYSLRAFAKSLKMSPSFLSAILSGKKKIPTQRIESFTKILQMDIHSKKLFIETLSKEYLSENQFLDHNIKQQLLTSAKQSRKAIAQRKEGSITEFSVFERWYHIPLLDLVTCTHFEARPEWIAEKLNITAREAKLAFESLLQRGLIEEKNGKWSKIEQKKRYPTTTSLPLIREYHHRMIGKAIEVLKYDIKQTDFEKRMITAISFAMNPEKIEKGRERLNELLYEITDILSEGPCSEVYQLNIQLFPLTKNKK